MLQWDTIPGVIRRLATVTLVSAVAGAGIGAAGSAGAATTAAPKVQPGIRAAVQYAAARDMRTGIAVLDLQTGRMWSGGQDRRRFATASVVKTMIATRLLLTGQMHGAVQQSAWRMITASDNAAAWSLYPKVGRDGLLPWLEARYSLGTIGARPTMPGVWGSTQVTARGLVRFYRAVHADPLVWPWLGKAMHAYARRSSAGEPNAFGIAQVAPRAAIKNGWDVDRDVQHPRNAIINTTGLVDGDRYAVAILAEGPGRLYYAPGERVVTGAAWRIVAPLVGRPVRVPSGQPLIVLDPGHNGGNSTHLAQIDRLVYAGYGRYKPCNTTGTATNSGYPEHAFTWDVANRVRRQLLAHDVRVLMTRRSDTGVGPCVNRRAAIESSPGVTAAVAIHADGAPAADHGFHLCVDSRRPVGATAATVAHTTRLNAALRRSLLAGSGLRVARYLGRNGYYRRDDLAGLNLSTKPTAFLELGNMRNAGDARRLRSAAGRARIAAAITQGILAYLVTVP